MKTFYKVLKIVAIVAAIIGVIYVVAAYGDKIVAWAKKTLNRIFDKRTCFFDIDEQLPEDVDFEEDVFCDEAACEA